jgi:hypothetical protein
MPTKFQDISKAEWLAKVEKDLKGKPLSSLDFEVAGRRFSPFHHREDLPTSPTQLKSTPGWKIGVQISEQDIETANKIALEALTGGAESLWFSFYRPKTEAQKKRLLQGIYKEIVDIIIDEEETMKGRGSVVYDLLAASKRPEHIPTFFTFPSHDFNHTLAYNRAVRLCWQLIARESGHSTPCRLTSFVPQLNGSDVNLNKISSTAAAVASVCGGADTLFIAASEGSATAFSRRIARNIQHLLREESYLDRVADPAAGSYYLENLTDHLAKKIWKDFQQVHTKASQP